MVLDGYVFVSAVREDYETLRKSEAKCRGAAGNW
jgi:hypothetical protein